MKCNLIGGPFQHAHSSTWWKKSKFIEWNKNSYSENITFYVDDGIYQGLRDSFKGRKFAWNLESRSIFSVDFILKNIDQILNTYELIFTHNKQLIDINPDKIKFIPAMGFWIENPDVYSKTKLISMVSSNKSMTTGQKLRLKFISENHDKFDLFGRGFNTIEKKEDGLKDYMFSVAMENDKYNTYFTEKILDCFATGTIPIYYGTDNISEFFNMDGIIRFEDFDIGSLNRDIYYSKISAVKDNFERVKKFEIPEDIIFEKYLRYE
jgi:hypothetical protein